jgi:hypothetical protein
MPFLVLAVFVGVVFLLSQQKPPQPAPPPALPAKTGSGSDGGSALANNPAAAVAIAVVAGAEAGGAIDTILFGDPKTTGQTIRHEVAIVAGATITVALALLAYGYMSGPIVGTIIAICVFVYCTVAFIVSVIEGHPTQSDGIERFKKERDNMVTHVFNTLRPQPNLVGISDTELMREVLPFVDGYMQEKDENTWRLIVGIQAEHSTLDRIALGRYGNTDTILECAYTAKDYGDVIGVLDFDFIAHSFDRDLANSAYGYRGIPPELRLSYGGSAQDTGDISGKWATAYVPPEQQLIVVDTVTSTNLHTG